MYASSASEDYAALRAGRRNKSARPAVVRVVVIMTRCLECGKEIEYKPDKPPVCGVCWEKLNRKDSDR